MLRLNHNWENGILHVAISANVVAGVTMRPTHDQDTEATMWNRVSINPEGTENIPGAEHEGRLER